MLHLSIPQQGQEAFWIAFWEVLVVVVVRCLVCRWVS
nr:MAG TPA: hypothetical protein [Caudoviricetes sp.]